MDEDRIFSLIDLLETNLEQLKKRRPKSYEEYMASFEKRIFCERMLQILIEICIDISQLLVKDLKLGLPTEEEAIFDKLSEHNVVSEEMAVKLKGMKGFRNVLVHHYVKIKDGIVYANATDNLQDFVDFKAEILEFLREQKRKSLHGRKKGRA